MSFGLGAMPDAARLEEQESLVRIYRRIGSEPGVLRDCGMVVSVKSRESDLFGDETEVLRINSPDVRCDSVDANGFVSLRRRELEKTRACSGLPESDMVRGLREWSVASASLPPNPYSFVHAWIPRRWIVQSRSRALWSIGHLRDGVRTLESIYGDRIAVIPGSRADFGLFRRLAEAYDAFPGAGALLAAQVGLITWGEDADTACERQAELIREAERYAAERSVGVVRDTMEDDGRTAARRRRVGLFAPALRGTLQTILQRPVSLACDDSPPVMRLIDRPGFAGATALPPPFPEAAPLFRRSAVVLDDPAREGTGETKENIGKQLARAAEPGPVLVPGLGAWFAGANRAECEHARDLFRHAADIVGAAEALGGYAPLAEQEPLPEQAPMPERAPPAAPPESLLFPMRSDRRPPPGELAGKAALVTGGAKGIGLAIVRLFLQEGANVCIADIDEPALHRVGAELSVRHPHQVMTGRMDVTNEASVDAVVAEACRRFGGIDILVSNAGIAPFGSILETSVTEWERSFAVNATGHFLVSRSVIRVLLSQGNGGSLVFVNTKNVPAPGKHFGAYSCAKAAEAQLCRILAIEHGPDKIRSNMVNPDSIITDLWTPEMKRNRASAYGVEVGQFESFLRGRSLMNESVTVEDVAQAALFFASDRSRITTGCILSVDAGSREAFPR